MNILEAVDRAMQIKGVVNVRIDAAGGDLELSVFRMGEMPQRVILDRGTAMLQPQIVAESIMALATGDMIKQEERDAIADAQQKYREREQRRGIQYGR